MNHSFLAGVQEVPRGAGLRENISWLVYRISSPACLKGTFTLLSVLPSQLEMGVERMGSNLQLSRVVE